jgi:hypothetical protein
MGPHATREHPTLGTVRWDPEAGGWQCYVELRPGLRISIAAIVEESWAEFEPDALITLIADYVQWARQAEPECMRAMIDQMFVDYDTTWAADDPGDGYERLDREAFAGQIKLLGITLYHPGAADWIYDPADLFGGLSIALWLDENRTIRDATLFG